MIITAASIRPIHTRMDYEGRNTGSRDSIPRLDYQGQRALIRVHRENPYAQ